jgi:histone deacetylase complex regulatory component SIN3
MYIKHFLKFFIHIKNNKKMQKNYQQVIYYYNNIEKFYWKNFIDVSTTTTTTTPNQPTLLSETEVYSKVAQLFTNHDDLLAEFSQFLPDASQQPTVNFN